MQVQRLAGQQPCSAACMHALFCMHTPPVVAPIAPIATASPACHSVVRALAVCLLGQAGRALPRSIFSAPPIPPSTCSCPMG